MTHVQLILPLLYCVVCWQIPDWLSSNILLRELGFHVSMTATVSLLESLLQANTSELNCIGNNNKGVSFSTILYMHTIIFTASKTQNFLKVFYEPSFAQCNQNLESVKNFKRNKKPCI